METATPPNEFLSSVGDEIDSEEVQVTAPESPKVVQFSLLPTTQTTTVVTTTVVSTTFPPVVFKKPRRKISEWDSTTYPLHDSPTPSALQRFTFELDGRSATFTEREDSEQALLELEEVVRNLHQSPATGYTKREVKTDHAAPSFTKNRTPVDPRKRQQCDVSRNLVQSAAKRRHVSDARPSIDAPVHAEAGPLTPKPIRATRPSELLMDNVHPSKGSSTARSNSLLETTFADEKGVRGDLPAQSEMTSPQSLSLPSPSASPIVKASLYSESAYLENDLLERPTTQSDSAETQLNGLLTSYPQAASVLEIPKILDTFDELPSTIQSYLMYHLLKRCNKSTLQVVASVVNPALKRDFLDLLPYELSLHVMSYLDARSLARAAQVSRRWNQLVNEDEYTWKNRLEQDQYHIEEDEFERAMAEGWTSKEHSQSRRLSLRQEASSASGSAGLPPQIPRDQFAEMVDGGLKQPLVGRHLYKSIYKRHHLNYNAWMNPKKKPKHLSFESHGRHVVTCLQLDDEKIITGSEDSNINIFDVKTGELRLALEGHEGGVWALQYLGNTLVSGSTDRTVRIWDMLTGACLQVFEGHTSTVRCLQILPVPENMDAGGSSHIIITGSRDSTLRVWRMPNRDSPSSPTVRSPESTPVDNGGAYFIRALTGHTQSVRALAADGDTLVSGSYDCSVRVWRISTCKCVWKLSGHTQKVYSVVLDSKQNRCISGSMDCKVKIWDLATGSCLYTLEGHTSLVGLLSLSHDRLVSAAADSTLRVWDPKTSNCLQTLTAHTGAITCFQHDGDKVISGSDGTLKLWDLKTGQFSRDLLLGLTYVWQVRFDERRCVAAVQRNNMTFIEVLDFGAAETA